MNANVNAFCLLTIPLRKLIDHPQSNSFGSLHGGRGGFIVQEGAVYGKGYQACHFGGQYSVDTVAGIGQRLYVRHKQGIAHIQVHGFSNVLINAGHHLHGKLVVKGMAYRDTVIGGLVMVNGCIKHKSLPCTRAQPQVEPFIGLILKTLLIRLGSPAP